MDFSVIVLNRLFRAGVIHAAPRFITAAPEGGEDVKTLPVSCLRSPRLWNTSCLFSLFLAGYRV